MHHIVVSCFIFQYHFEYCISFACLALINFILLISRIVDNQLTTFRSTKCTILLPDVLYFNITCSKWYWNIKHLATTQHILLDWVLWVHRQYYMHFILFSPCIFNIWTKSRTNALFINNHYFLTHVSASNVAIIRENSLWRTQDVHISLRTLL
jgi:hypothetical protein